MSAAIVLVIGFIVTLPASALASSSMFTTVDGPGAFFTQATGINDSGQIVGTFINPTGVHAFLYSGGVVTTIDVPGEPLGINATGQIIRLRSGVGKSSETKWAGRPVDTVTEPRDGATADGG